MFVKKRRTWSQKLATDYLSVGFFASLFLINRYASLVTRPVGFATFDHTKVGIYLVL
jgi:hypothetical protein